MPRKVPLDLCMFCDQNPCACSDKVVPRPRQIKPHVLETRPVVPLAEPNTVTVDLPPMDFAADNVRARMMRRATIVRPVAEQPAGTAGLPLEQPAGPAPHLSQRLQHEIALDLLVTKLGARPISPNDDPAQNPQTLAEAVRKKYE